MGGNCARISLYIYIIYIYIYVCVCVSCRVVSCHVCMYVCVKIYNTVYLYLHQSPPETRMIRQFYCTVSSFLYHGWSREAPQAWP